MDALRCNHLAPLDFKGLIFRNLIIVCCSCDTWLVLLLCTVSSLSTVAENVDVYDVSISYGTYNGSNLLVIVAVMNSCCRPLRFLAPRSTCLAERINASASRWNRPVCPLLMLGRSCRVRDVGSGDRPTTYTWRHNSNIVRPVANRWTDAWRPQQPFTCFRDWPRRGGSHVH